MTGEALFFIDRKAEGEPAAIPTASAPEEDAASLQKAAGGAVWEDEDDGDAVFDGRDVDSGMLGGDEASFPASRKRATSASGDDAPTKQSRLSVNLHAKPSRRKLRKSVTENVVGPAEYRKRVRDHYSTEGRRVAAGTWAELPSDRKRRRMARKSKGKAGAEEAPKKDSADETTDDDEGENAMDDGGLGDFVTRKSRSTGVIVPAREERERGRTRLEKGVLDIRRVTNLNSGEPNRAVVQALEFHPSGRVALTAGFDKTLRLFAIDGKRNEKVHGLRVEDLPIHCAHFMDGGREVVLTGRKPFMYSYDVESGAATKVHTLSRGARAERSLERCVASPAGDALAVLAGKGKVLLVCNRSKQQTGILRMDQAIGSAAFSATTEHHLYTSGHGGAAYLWDTRMHRCMDRHADHGTLLGTALASSPAGHYAVGSDAGVVNVYRGSCMSGGAGGGGAADRRETPEKAVMNLSTGISALSFNTDGRLLALASRSLKNAVRILHVPSMTVYNNWPTQKVNLRRVSCLAFSPSGGYLACGNDKGDAALFRIRSGYPAF